MIIPKASRDEFKMISLVATLIVAFAVFAAVVVFLLFKIVHKRLSSEFEAQIAEKLAQNGIRPISNVIPPELNNRLEQCFEQRRGTLPPTALRKLANKNVVRFL